MPISRRLRGLPLKELDLTGTAVADLMPLQSLESLETLRLADCPIVDLAPLRGCAFANCTSRNLPASDLSPLRGLPLRVLVLWNSPNLRGLRMLGGTARAGAARSAVAGGGDARGGTRSHRRVADPSRACGRSARNRRCTDAAASTSIPGREEFFREWDRAAGWRLALHRQGAEVKVSRIERRRSRIEIKGRAVHDLSALRGLKQVAGRPLHELVLSRTVRRGSRSAGGPAAAASRCGIHRGHRSRARCKGCRSNGFA